MAATKEKRARKIDVSTALDLRQTNGLTYRQIAALQGVTPQAVHQALQPLLPDPSLIKDFTTNHISILQHAQLKALTAYIGLDDEQQKSMISRRGMVDMGILFDKTRLLQGLSTVNQATLHGDILAIKEAVVDGAVLRGGHRSTAEEE